MSKDDFEEQKFKGWCSAPSPQLTGKLLAVTFWMLLNAMVLSVCLADESELSDGLKRGEVVPKLFLALVTLTGCLYLSAAFMDPGYLPDKPTDDGDLKHDGGNNRGAPPPPGAEGTTLPDDLTGKSRDAIPQAQSEVKVPCLDLTYHKYIPSADDPINNDTYCKLCDKNFPYRAKHCSSCDKCVSRYDHHCIWLGNCVGERNHALFWWYLVCQSMTIIWGLYYIESAIKWHGFSSQALGAIEGFIWMNGLKIIIFFFILIWSWLPVCLLAYHTYLLSTNQTTWEFNRRQRITYLRKLDPDERPFDAGPLKNLLLLCCMPKLFDWQKMMHTTEPVIETEP